MTNTKFLYVASHTKRNKVTVLASSPVMGLVIWAGISTRDWIFTVFFVLLFAAVSCETFLQKLMFTDSELIYTNMFGKKRILPYLEIASLRYVIGSKLTITALDGSRIKLAYGDFVRMVDIIGMKTNRQPPLEIAELSFRFLRAKRQGGKTTRQDS